MHVYVCVYIYIYIYIYIYMRMYMRLHTHISFKRIVADANKLDTNARSHARERERERGRKNASRATTASRHFVSHRISLNKRNLEGVTCTSEESIRKT